MKLRAVLLVCAVLAVASSLTTCQNGFNFEYIDWSLSEQECYAKTGETKQALEWIQPIEDEDVTNKLIRYQKRIEFLGRLTGTSEHQARVYNNLLLLGEGTMSSDQFSTLTRYMMEICYVLSDKDANLSWFADYLRVNGQRTFAKFIQTSIDALLQSGSEDNKRAETALDVAFGMNDYSLGDRLEILEKFEMRTYNYDRAVILGANVGARADLVSLFFEGFLGNCQRLRLGREFHMIVITLATTFGVPSDTLPPEVKILREYNRLCASALLDETKEAVRIQKEAYQFIPPHPSGI